MNGKRNPTVRFAQIIGKDEEELDEVIATNASVHLEQMDDNAWWLSIRAGGQTVTVNLVTKRAPISAHVEIEDAE
jgi:hypothetical protein